MRYCAEGMDQADRPESIKARRRILMMTAPEKAGNPMEVSETARADGISMCESPAHVCEGGCGDPVRSVHLMDRCL